MHVNAGPEVANYPKGMGGGSFLKGGVIEACFQWHLAMAGAALESVQKKRLYWLS